MGSPCSYRLVLYHGDDLNLHMEYYSPKADGTPDYDNPIDLTGYSAEFKVWVPSTGQVLIDKDTTSGITLGGTAGTIDVSVPAADIDALAPTDDEEYKWCLQVESSAGAKDVLVYGPCLVIKSWVPSS